MNRVFRNHKHHPQVPSYLLANGKALRYLLYFYPVRLFFVQFTCGIVVFLLMIREWQSYIMYIVHKTYEEIWNDRRKIFSLTISLQYMVSSQSCCRRPILGVVANVIENVSYNLQKAYAFKVTLQLKKEMAIGALPYAL